MQIARRCAEAVGPPNGGGVENEVVLGTGINRRGIGVRRFPAGHVAFGNHFKVFDNRTEAFLREGVTSNPSLLTVDATSFSLISTLDTSIHNEELY